MEYLGYCVYLAVGDDERRQEAHDAAVAPAHFDDDSALQALGLDPSRHRSCMGGNAPVVGLTRWVDDFDPKHQPPPPHFANPTAADLVQVGEESLAHHLGMLPQSVLQNVTQGSKARRHSQLVPPERARVGSRLPAVEGFAVDHYRQG